MSETMSINGVEYAPVSSRPTGSRCIVVLDRGWIFVGNLSTDGGVSTLSSAANIRKWGSGGFGGLTADPKGAGAVLDQCEDITFDERAPLFCVPVPEDWNA